MQTHRESPGTGYVAFERAPGGVIALTTTRDVAADPDRPSLPGPALRGALGLDAAPIAWCEQVHGPRILASTTGGRQGEADALVTDRAEIVLSIRTADCVPVFLADAERGALALLHAGWRGIDAGVVERSVDALDRLYGSPPDRLWAGIGPAIGPRSYEVGAEVAERFAPVHLTAIPRTQGRWLLDLPGAAAAELERMGVTDIERSGLCTFEATDRFYSHRRDGSTGRLYSLIWRRPRPRRTRSRRARTARDSDPRPPPWRSD